MKQYFDSIHAPRDCALRVVIDPQTSALGGILDAVRNVRELFDAHPALLEELNSKYEAINTRNRMKACVTDIAKEDGVLFADSRVFLFFNLEVPSTVSHVPPVTRGIVIDTRGSEFEAPDYVSDEESSEGEGEGASAPIAAGTTAAVAVEKVSECGVRHMCVCVCICT